MRVATVFTLVLVLLVCVFSPPQAPAEMATQGEMELVSQNWLAYIVHQKGAWAGETRPQIVDVEEILERETVLARCFSITPSGFVVVPVLKELPPIKAYSEEYDLDVDQRVGFPQLLKEVLLHRIRLYAKKYGSLDAVQPSTGDVLLGRKHKAEWNQFLKSEKEFKADLIQDKFQTLTEVGPLLTTSWHQYSPYNNFCPIGYDNDICVVGCVATAAAQIMRYWNWPPSGTGSHTYWWDGDDSCDGPVGGGWLSADFSDPYVWQYMPDHCESGCSQAEQAVLAELCYEVGVAFEMDYGVCGSGTWTYQALTVFPTYFRYDSSIDKEDRHDHTAAEWFSIIQTEINNVRPMQYRISRHSIVCDGWRDTGGLNQYHMNYGWGGSFNAWYTIDDLYCTWEGCDPMVEYMIRNIIPMSDLDFVRGDVDASGEYTLADGLFLLNYFFNNSPVPVCMDACDVDDSGDLTLSDGLWCLNYFFTGSPPIPPPSPDCGPDPTPDALYGGSFPYCETKGKVAASAPAASVKGASEKVIVRDAVVENGEVVVPVQLVNTLDITGVDITLGYDASVLEAEKVDGGADYDYFVGYTGDAGQVRIGVVPDFEMKDAIEAGERVIAEVVFKVKGDLGSGVKISVERADLYGRGAKQLKSEWVDGLVKASIDLPSKFALSQNYPNPFNPTTKIKYNLPKDCYVRLEVFNVLGESVASLINGKQAAGYKATTWNPRDMASGIYFYRLTAGDFTSIRKMVLLK